MWFQVIPSLEGFYFFTLPAVVAVFWCPMQGPAEKEEEMFELPDFLTKEKKEEPEEAGERWCVHPL